MSLSPKTPGLAISGAGLATGGILVVICILKSIPVESDRYWPLLAVGASLIFISAPFYSYFKAQDKVVSPYHNAEVDALAAAAKMLRVEKLKQQEVAAKMAKKK